MLKSSYIYTIHILFLMMQKKDVQLQRIHITIIANLYLNERICINVASSLTVHIIVSFQLSIKRIEMSIKQINWKKKY